MSELAPEYLESNSKTLFGGCRDGLQLKQYTDLPKKKNRIWFPAAQQGSSQLPITPATWEPRSLLHYCTNPHSDTQTHN